MNDLSHVCSPGAKRRKKNKIKISEPVPMYASKYTVRRDVDDFEEPVVRNRTGPPR